MSEIRTLRRPTGRTGPFVDLESVCVDSELVRSGRLREYLEDGWMPLSRAVDGTMLVAAADPSTELRDRIEHSWDMPVEFVKTDAWALKTAVLRAMSGEVVSAAAEDLWLQNPDLSARRVLTRQQQVIGIVLVAALGLALVLATRQTLAGIVAVSSAVFLAVSGFKLLVALRGARFDVVERVSDADVAVLADADLPRYTVLVPVFHEANIVAQLVRNLGGIDYPADKLEVLVLLEEGDDETLAAVERSAPPANFRIVVVPPGHPQTKPRACNVGLMLATGEFLVIFDAEDTPDPDQLKKAIVAFRRGGPQLVCVQAALNYFNANENVLTRMFTLEYSYWFDYMLAGLDAADLPIPLGGTSNHFRVDGLRALGGWDPYNVTEDADLGIRAAALNYRVGVINSTTMEEANTSIPNFIRQRSRWIKGYMQTALVHARHPQRLINVVGLRRFAAFVLLIAGTPLAFLGVLPFFALTIASMLAPTQVISALFPVPVLWLCLMNFILGNGLMVYLSMMGPFKRGALGLVTWALLNPLYWLLHSIAAYKGLWQLATRPHYWEKTDHGLTAHVD